MGPWQNQKCQQNKTLRFSQIKKKNDFIIFTWRLQDFKTTKLSVSSIYQVLSWREIFFSLEDVQTFKCPLDRKKGQKLTSSCESAGQLISTNHTWSIWVIGFVDSLNNNSNNIKCLRPTDGRLPTIRLNQTAWEIYFTLQLYFNIVYRCFSCMVDLFQKGKFLLKLIWKAIALHKQWILKFVTFS